MPIPSPSTLERLLAPYAGAHGLPVRVWGVDAGAHSPGFACLEQEVYPDAGPRLLCLGASEDGLVFVRQTRDTLEDLDGARVAWQRVRRLERDPHLAKDLLLLEVDGRPVMRVAVANHLLLPANRHAAKDLADLATHRRVESDEHELHEPPLSIA